MESNADSFMKKQFVSCLSSLIRVLYWIFALNMRVDSINSVNNIHSDFEWKNWVHWIPEPHKTVLSSRRCCLRMCSLGF